MANKIHLRVAHCNLAGVTSDGKKCYWGKKDSDDHESRDLQCWVTLGPPRIDGENYVRLQRIGFDEDHAMKLMMLLTIPYQERADKAAERLRAHLLTVSSAEMKKQFGKNPGEP